MEDERLKQFIESTVKSVVEDGLDGVDGRDGRNGSDGYSPVRGKDYWTEEDKTSIISEIVPLIPIPQEVNLDEVISRATEEIKKEPIDFKDIKGTEKLVEYLKAGGFRGGGFSGVVTDATLTGTGLSSNPLHVVSGAGSPLTTKGDLYTYSTTNTRLPVGTNGQFLLADSTATTGLKWNTITTSNIPEGTNLYYTQARFDTAFAAKSTTNLAEGTNLYYTNARGIGSVLTGYVSGAGTVSATDTILQAIQKLNGNTAALVTGVSSVFGRTGAVVAVSGDYNTSQVTENTNLYFTNARAIASTLTGYTSGAGTITSSDSILTAIQKLNGNATSLYVPYTGATGDVTLGTHGFTTTALNVNGTITQNSAYAKFGNASPFVPYSAGVITESWGNENNTTGVEMGVGNRSNGTSAFGGFFMNNDLAVDGLVDHFVFMGLNSSTYTDTTFGTALAVANQFNFQNTDGPIVYITNKTGSTGAHIWYAGGTATTNEVFRITNTLATLSAQLNWNTSLGAITHLLGPTDQTFLLKAGTPVQTVSAQAGHDLTISASPAVVASGGTAGSAAGGAVNINGGDGKGTTSGNASGGGLNFNGGNAANISNTNAGGSITSTGGNALGAGTSSTGGDIVNITGNGSSGSASRAGNWTVTIGTGGASAAGTTSATGGITLTSGVGRPTSGVTGNTGGITSLIGGIGGLSSAVAGTGGVGGATTIRSGDGGAANGASGTRVGGNSGVMTIGSGAGGIGGTANGVGGQLRLQTNATNRLVFTDTLATFSTPVQLQVGTATAGTAPLYFVSGTNLTSPVAGAMEYDGTQLYFSPSTTRQALIQDNGTRLTSGRVPFAGTNGYLQDDADMTFATDTLTVTKIIGSTSVTSALINSTGTVRLKGYTVATLPGGTIGDTAYVTDALAPAFLTIIVGGGTVVTPVFYNGTNWIGY